MSEIEELARESLLAYACLVNENYEIPNHILTIAKVLERVERGELKRVIITIPPRHGKSMLCSQYFPAWYMGRNPSKYLITATYGQDLSDDFGRKVRDQMERHEFKSVFPEARLRRDSRASARFETEKGGTFFGVGVGGPITGRGAHCFPTGTLIETDNGKIPIELCNNGTRVLSINHDTNLAEWKRVVAKRVIVKREFREITSASGHRVIASADHPFFVPGRGYVEAKDIREGERCWVFKGQEKSDSSLHAMRQRISQRMGRIYKESKNWTARLLLLSKMFRATSCGKEQEEMFNLFGASGEKNKEILFGKMQAKLKKAEGFSLQIMQEIIQAAQQTFEVLFNGMQKQLSLATHVGEQPKLQAWQVSSDIPKRFSEKEIYNWKRKKQKVHCLWGNQKFGIASSRLQPEEQRRCQSGFGLQALSHNPPQIKEDAISSIVAHSGDQVVYDLQVEDNENFFANGFLVHNCLLIDDPIKNREEADSVTQLQKIVDWYGSVAYTRLMPDAAIVVIMTRWAEGDLVGHLTEKNKHEGWEKIDLSAVDKVTGNALWPARYSLEDLQRIRSTIGEYDWSCLYQQSPIPKEGIIFKPEWLHSGIEHKYAACFIAMDCAISQKTQADETAICVVKIPFGNSPTIDEVVTVHGRMSFLEQIAALRGLIAEHKPIITGVEGDRGGKIVVEVLRKERISVIELPAIADKVTRAMTVSHLFAQGKIRVNTPELRSQLLAFRGASEKNDLADAHIHAIRLCLQCSSMKYENPIEDFDPFKNPRQLISYDQRVHNFLDKRRKQSLKKRSLSYQDPFTGQKF